MKLFRKMWVVLIAVTLFAVIPALAEDVSTPSDVECAHVTWESSYWEWHYDETHHWEECVLCGELRFSFYPEKHAAWCSSPNECFECGASCESAIICHDESSWTQMKNENEHWWLCGCGEELDHQVHWAFCGSNKCRWCGWPSASITRHSFDDYEMEYDETYHWSTCIECGQFVKEKHYKIKDDYLRDICAVCGEPVPEPSDEPEEPSAPSSPTTRPTTTSGASGYLGVSASATATADAQTLLNKYPYEDGMPRAAVYAPRTGKASLRETASTSARALTQLVDGTVVIVLGEKGKFTQVSFDDVTGYILTSALEMLDMEQLPLGEGMLTYPTTGGRGTTTVNVRSEASSRARKIDAWPTGTIVLVWSVTEDRQWYEIEYESVRVYVKAEFLTVTQIYDYTTEETDEVVEIEAEA